MLCVAFGSHACWKDFGFAEEKDDRRLGDRLSSLPPEK
jgi:hypothetical protein